MTQPPTTPGMTPRNEYVYSQLSAKSVRHLLAANYPLPELTDCRFYMLGLHDNYLVECGRTNYILRLYRNDWRSHSDVLFELELLAYLRTRNAPVAGPVRTAHDELVCRVASPEGERLAALFEYAEGEAVADALCAEDCSRLGRAVASVHALAMPFHTRHVRPILDVAYLLDESIATIEPFVDTAMSQRLREMQTRLHSNLPRLPEAAGVYGICIGDVNPSNFHMRQDKQITLFDFDQCGYGWRAFEIGKFASSIMSHQQKPALLAAFLDGYQQLRELQPAESAAVPYFEMIAIIWVMAIHARNADRIGHKHLARAFWQRKIMKLQELERQLSIE
jgi:Ser/Thr protein kinase RdoA (MazF antagonist)